MQVRAFERYIPLKSLKRVASFFFQNFSLIWKMQKCNFTDFDTSSVLQINCSKPYRVSFPYGFAAIVCQSEIM